MSDKGVTDEMLMSFVDGELDEGSAAAVDRAVRADPHLAARLESFRASRQATRDVFAGILGEPAPDRLVDSVLDAGGRDDGANVVAFRRRPRAVQAITALAATLVVAAGMGGYWFGQTGGATPVGTVALLDGDAALLEALATSPSGATVAVGGADLDLQASYRIAGGVCRSFVLAGDTDGVRGLACNRGAGWSVDIAVADASAGGTGFSPASDRAAATLDGYLMDIEAEGPLDAAEESALREGGWTE